ncbi:hypothetical protein AYI69_g739 [Smittium culicis]|uniref:Uncharacterized protein n=1 Tax=Smittium culicis TaxID=133412 RepID=A0A1R1YS75_9FUNG|nr:hypothetical protein AYI69_g739 [Smittium culicis]
MRPLSQLGQSSSKKTIKEYDFELFHRAGKDNQVADYLFSPVLMATNANVAPDSTNLTEISWEQIRRFLSGETDEHQPRARQQARNFI